MNQTARQLTRETSFLSLLACVWLLAAASATHSASVQWDGGAGTDVWHEPQNWSNDQVPTAADDVTIATGSRVVFTQGSAEVNSLSVSRPFEITGGALDVRATAVFYSSLSLAGGVLSGQMLEMQSGEIQSREAYSTDTTILIRGGPVTFAGNLSRSVTLLLRAGPADIAQAILQTPVGTVTTNRGTISFQSSGAHPAYFRMGEQAGEPASVLINEGRLIAGSDSEWGSDYYNAIYAGLINRGTIEAPTRMKLYLGATFTNQAGSILTEGSGSIRIGNGMIWEGGSEIRGSVAVRGGSLSIERTLEKASTLYLEEGPVTFLGNLATNLSIVLQSGPFIASKAFLETPAGFSVTNRGTISFNGSHAAYLQNGEKPGEPASRLVNEGRLVAASDNSANAVYCEVINRGLIEAPTRTKLYFGASFTNQSGVVQTQGAGSIRFGANVMLADGTWFGEAEDGIDLAGASFVWQGGQILSGVTLTAGSLRVLDSVLGPSELRIRNNHSFFGNESPQVILRLSNAGAYFTIPTDVVAVNNGTIQMEGSSGGTSISISERGAFINLGRMELNGPQSIVGSWQNAGEVFLKQGTLNLGGAGNRVDNYGTMIVDLGTIVFNGVTLRNFQGATISASGTLAIGAGQFIHEGTLDPRSAIGGLRILGTFAPASESRLIIDIDAYQAEIDRGFNPGVTFDQLDVGGPAVLNGALEVRFAGDQFGFPVFPPLDVPLAIVKAGSLTGTFQRTNALRISVSETLEAQYGPAELNLIARSANNSRPLIIRDQPASQTVRLGVSVSFIVIADGTPPLRFQWFRNGVAIPGATNDVLAIPSVESASAGTFEVSVVDASEQPLLSQAAALRVILPDLFLTDRFAERLTYRTAEFVGATNNVGATFEGAAGEPRHAGKVGGKSMWMTWQSPANGVVTFSTKGSSFDTLLAVYEGKDLSALKAGEVAHDEDSGEFLTSRTSFNAIMGREYEIAVDGYAGAIGDIVLSWALQTNGAVVPRIVQHPAVAPVIKGSSVNLSVAAEGPALSYQWYLNDSPIPGAVSHELILAAASELDAGSYRVGIRSAGGPEVLSDPAVIQIVLNGQVEVGMRDKLEDFLQEPVQLAPASLRPLAAGAGGPFASVSFGIGPGLAVNNEAATRQQGEPIPCAINPDSATLWWRLRPVGSGNLTLDTLGSVVDTVLAIHRWRGRLEFLDCNDDFNRVDGTSKLTVAVTAGEDYFVQVDTVNGTGLINLHWNLAGGSVLTPFELHARLFEDALELRFAANPGRYRIEVSSNLLNWSLLREEESKGGEKISRVERVPTHSGQFFRIR